MKLSRKEALIAGVLTVFAVSTAGLIAQGTLWDTDVISWRAPTACTNGAALTACPVTGYEVVTAATATATDWTPVATVAGNVLVYSKLRLLAGPHCYRVRALSAGGASVYSNTACSTTVKPADPLPEPPVLRTIDDPTVAYRVTQGNTNRIAASRIGTVPLGVLCDPLQPVLGRFVIKDRFQVVLDPGISRPLAAIARCG